MSSIAVIGASADKEKFGNKCVRAYKEKGYKVYPVNPKEKEIEGLKCYKSVLDIKDNVDIASLYLPPSIGFKIIEEIIKKNIKEVFLNPGAESEEIEKKLKNTKIKIRKECSIRAIGINPSRL